VPEMTCSCICRNTSICPRIRTEPLRRADDIFRASDSKNNGSKNNGLTNIGSQGILRLFFFPTGNLTD